MALRDSPAEIEYPDHAVPVAGDHGDLMSQETGSGKAIFRRGAGEGQADIDIGSAAEPHDLDSDGDFNSGPLNAGGAEALAGEIVSDDDADFTVTIEWLNNDDEVVITHDPAALNTVSDIDFNIIMRSDRFRLTVTDESGGQNRIHGTANAH